MYDIEIHYETGDSFGSSKETETLGLVTSSLKEAKENLQRIKEHYKLAKESPNFDKRYALSLKCGNKEERTISPFWIGYFESLISARIILVEEEDMEFLP